MTPILLAFLLVPAPEPILGGQKQIVLGLKPEATVVLSYYIWVKEKPNEYGSSINEYAQRMGYLSAGVKYDTMNNSQVFRFDSDARAKNPKKEYDLGVGAAERLWVNKDGHIFRHMMTVQTPKNGERVLDIVYGTQSIEVSVTENGKETSSTMYPEGGCQPFFDRFKPMVVDGKVVLKEKKFNIIDPYTLGIVSCKAEVGGRFNGTILLKRMKGSTYDITMGGKRQRAFLDEANNLVKVEISEETYFQIDSLPTSGDASPPDGNALGG